MRFRFIGNGDNDPVQVTLHGVTFPLGKSVDVTDEVLAAKLRANSHFDVPKGRKPKVEDAKDET